MLRKPCAINFQSVANQTRFVLLRDQILQVATAEKGRTLLASIEKIVKEEKELAIRLHAIQQHDSRVGFEAACQYFFVGVDLGEKIINCQDILSRWIPEQAQRISKLS